ncbi:hypothetical protein BDK51DRAFT_46717 [Blyttiomyces helicus]|uniref:Uncharacterized protein n=1 Tax=Blyttiomyces helicus TaxID=388810 RepID=A0A4P9VWJ9_9FUNG|nr:hypothetical protein BDK51DRAFT_46717 [Blyttiomyces helicus]|eukprot:RKO84089.1 hypothetical protein BDK51DRAFT_46717 [Blyttiomyces helicus]
MASFAANSDTEQFSGPETGHATMDPRLPSDLSGSDENDELDLDDDQERNDHSEELERGFVEESPKESHSRHRSVEESAKKRKLEVAEMSDEVEEENVAQELAMKGVHVAEKAPSVPKRRVGRPQIHPPKQGPPKPRGRPRKNPPTEPRLPPKPHGDPESAATSALLVSQTLAEPVPPLVLTSPVHPGFEIFVTPPSPASSLATRSKPPVTDPAPIHAPTSFHSVAVDSSAPIPVAGTFFTPSIASLFAVGGPVPAPATSPLAITDYPNEASVYSVIVEPQGWCQTRQRARGRTQPYPPFPLTEDAFPAGLTNDKLARRLTISEKAFKHTEAARNMAEEEERFEKLMESKMARRL